MPKDIKRINNFDEVISSLNFSTGSPDMSRVVTPEEERKIKRRMNNEESI